VALFVPDPEDFDPQDLISDLSFELAERYRDVEDQLIAEIAQRAYRDLDLAARLPTDPGGLGLTAADRRQQNRILAELAANRARAIRELQEQAVAMIEQLRSGASAEAFVRIAVEQGEAAAVASLGLGGVRGSLAQIPALTAYSSTYSVAGAIVAVSLQNRLEALNERITRYPQDAYQRIVALTSPKTILGVNTQLRSQQEIVRNFLRAGIDGFTDRSDRRWSIGAYAEMASRTSAQRAMNDATAYRLQQGGLNLGTITGGFDACDKCAPWIGKIISLDGSPAGPRTLPHATQNTTVTIYVAGSLDDARAAGWGHPNDRCGISGYHVGLPVPQADFEYNAKADAERQEQRALEREVRAAKRDLATAPNDIERRRAHRDIAAAQAELRDFTRRTGRHRQSYREQLGFSGG